MPQTALPQSTLPLLDRVTVATPVAGPVAHAQAMQIGVGPKSGAHSATMEFADYFEIISAFREPQPQTTLSDMPQIPVLAGSPRKETKSAESEVIPGFEETTETVDLRANVNGGPGANEADPILQALTDTLHNGPPKPLKQIVQAAGFFPDSAVSDNANSDDPPPVDRSHASSRPFVPQPQPDLSARSAMPFANNGTETAPARKGAIGDIFSVMHRQILHQKQFTETGTIGVGEVARIDGAHSPEAAQSAAVPRIFPDDLSDMMPQSPIARLAHPHTAGPARTDADSIDRTSTDPTVQESPPVTLLLRGNNPTSELYQAKTRRPAPVIAQANVPRTAVDQSFEASAEPPTLGVLTTGSADMPEIVPIRVDAIQPEPPVRNDTQTALPQQIVLPTGLGLPAVDQLVPHPSRATVNADRGTFALPFARIIAEPVKPQPSNPVATSANFQRTTEGDILRFALVQSEASLLTRFDQFRPQQFSPDVTEITVNAGMDHRAIKQPEQAVMHHAQPSSQNDDPAEERLRNLTVHDTRTAAPSEHRPPAQTAAIAAPAYLTTLQPNSLPAPEKSAPKHLSDIALPADFSVASRPVEDLQNVTRPGTGPSSELIRQVFQNTLLPSKRVKEGPVEIRLNPQELGHVRINISMAEGAITMSIHAERSETLELLRRNIEQLSQEFRQIGYGNISFSFGQNARQNEGRHKDMSINRASANAGTDIPQDLPVRPDVRTSGVDLRV